jgi:hypothetical protein
MFTGACLSKLVLIKQHLPDVGLLGVSSRAGIFYILMDYSNLTLGEELG